MHRVDGIQQPVQRLGSDVPFFIIAKAVHPNARIFGVCQISHTLHIRLPCEYPKVADQNVVDPDFGDSLLAGNPRRDLNIEGTAYRNFLDGTLKLAFLV